MTGEVVGRSSVLQLQPTLEQSRTRAATVIVERITYARGTIKAKASLSRQCSHEFILAICYTHYQYTQHEEEFHDMRINMSYIL